MKTPNRRLDEVDCDIHPETERFEGVNGTEPIRSWKKVK